MKEIKVKTNGGTESVPVKATSSQYSLSLRDTLKALIVAAGTPVLVLIQNSLDAGSMVFNWKQLGMAALAGFIAYLAKNFFTPSQVIIKAKDLE